MCGLVGVAAINGKALSDRGVKVFKHLLYLDVLRGEHSTGICMVDTNKNVKLHKHLGPPSKDETFSNNEIFSSTGNVFNPIVLIGHNRYATKGEVNVENAHPFVTQDENIIGAHNGTVYNYILDRIGKNPFETDSEFIYNSIAERGLKETVKYLDGGAYALTWWNKEENTINILRNNERPLYIAKSGGAIVWASEKWMIDVASSRVGCEVSDVGMVNIDKHLKYHIPSEEVRPEIEEVKPEKRVYSFREGSNTASQGNYSYRSNYDSNVSYLNNGKPRIKLTSLNKLLRTQVRVVANRICTDSSGHNYMDMSIIEVLGDIDKDFDMSTVSVRAYLNGSKISQDLLMELFDDKDEEETYFITVKLKKLKASDSSGKQFYGIVDLRSIEMIEQYVFEEETEGTEAEEKVEWYKKTKQGCCHCNAMVTYENRKEVFWVSNDTFFCEDCCKAGTPEQYGIEQHKAM